MSRTTIVLVVSLLLAVSTRAAGGDTFGGWQYTRPQGYTAEENPDHVALTQQTTEGFCSIALFEARTRETSVRAEAAYDWYNIVEHSFTVRKTLRRSTSRTAEGAPYSATTASLVDGSGAQYVGVHYAVAPSDVFGSVLLTTSSTSMLPSCERVATGFVRALVIDWSSPRFTDPEARAETTVGRWARLGDTNREYTFVAAGAYRFRSETANRIVQETGTYTLRGHQLVLTPKTSSIATIKTGAVTWSPGKLEVSTYMWSKRYNLDSNEWRIVLSPRKATTRDGKLVDDEGYPYSDSVKPVWRYFAAQPGA